MMPTPKYRQQWRSQPLGLLPRHTRTGVSVPALLLPLVLSLGFGFSSSLRFGTRCSNAVLRVVKLQFSFLEPLTTCPVGTFGLRRACVGDTFVFFRACVITGLFVVKTKAFACLSPGVASLLKNLIGPLHSSSYLLYPFPCLYFVLDQKGCSFDLAIEIQASAWEQDHLASKHLCQVGF